jgi:membrane associated rhomboid family serine protease
MHLSITIIIIIITCLISITAFSNRGEMDKLLFWPALVKEKKQYYRFITSGFIHAGWGHLALNMFTLFFFGAVVEQYFKQLFGPGVFILFYLLSIIAADLPDYFKYGHNYEFRSLGASGAISAVVFASILFDPWQKLYLFIIPIGIPGFIFGALWLLYSFYMSKRGGDYINHNAHIWGAIFGIVFTLALEPKIGPFFIQQLMNGR